MSKSRTKRKLNKQRRQTLAASTAKRKGRVTMEATSWDHGATGQANRVGLVIEDRGEKDPATGKVVNPNNVTGVRRYDMLEVYAKRGWISTRAHGAGELLRLAWLKTEIGTCAPWLRERVDSSPKPDLAVTIQIKRMSALLRVSKLIDQDDERIVFCVCCDGGSIGRLPEYRGDNHDKGKAHISAALERLADRIEGLR